MSTSTNTKPAGPTAGESRDREEPSKEGSYCDFPPSRENRTGTPGLESIGAILDRMAGAGNRQGISEERWAAVVRDVFLLAAPRGGSDVRAERMRRALHELAGDFVSAETWELVRGLLALPEPILRVVVAHAQVQTGLIYSTSPRDRKRRENLLGALLREAATVSAERRAA